MFRCVHHWSGGDRGHHLHHCPVRVSAQVQEGESRQEREGELPAQRRVRNVPPELPAVAELTLHCGQELLRG